LEGGKVDELAQSARAQGIMPNDTHGNGKVVGAHRCSNCGSAHDFKIVLR
jgi:hypothetical protein